MFFVWYDLFAKTKKLMPFIIDAYDGIEWYYMHIYNFLETQESNVQRLSGFSNLRRLFTIDQFYITIIIHYHKLFPLLFLIFKNENTRKPKA